MLLHLLWWRLLLVPELLDCLGCLAQHHCQQLALLHVLWHDVAWSLGCQPAAAQIPPGAPAAGTLLD